MMNDKVFWDKADKAVNAVGYFVFFVFPLWFFWFLIAALGVCIVILLSCAIGNMFT